MSEERHPKLRLVPTAPQAAFDPGTWLQRMRGLRDPATHLAKMLELLREEPEPFASLFTFLGGQLGSELGRAAYLDALRLLSGARPVRYEVLERVYAQAVRGSDPVLRLLVLRHHAPPPTELRSEPMDPRLEDRSLGERKAMARTADMDLMQALARDPEPSVIRNLLDHPRATLDLVLRIATRRPAHPETLAACVHHRRWGAHQDVQEAVCRNPHAAPGLAAALVPLMPPSVRREIRKGSAAQPLVAAIVAWVEGDPEPLEGLLG